ncbi:MAG TPA: ABC transporter substrate-binding protein, partial [Oligoflexia bacterium]|nr:ABC transporter substrate-binding protein [Oligoflexia bacterium]
MKIRPRKTVLVLFVISALLAAALVLWLSLDGKTKPAEQTSGLWNNVTGGDVITVGVFASKQGDFAAYGRSIEQGAMAALEVINARDGILGRPVRIEVVDPRSQPALIRPLAEELVQKNKAALLVGTAGEEETLAAADAAADLGVPFIYV